MKPIPSFVNVGGKRVRIRVVPDMEDWGEYDHDAFEIRISTKALVKRSLIRETLRHELMHAALSIGGVSYAERPDEEAFVRCMENILFPAWDRLSEKLNTQIP